jgi:hypothetical protein
MKCKRALGWKYSKTNFEERHEADQALGINAAFKELLISLLPCS